VDACRQRLGVRDLTVSPSTRASAEAATGGDVGSIDVAEIHGPFLDTAAILRCLDVVVTSDTSLAHLAGALGIETWLAVPHVPEWRWLLEREDTPWYPTLHLVRQSHVGQWGGVFVRIAAALRNRAVAAQRRGLVDPQSPPDLPSR